MTRTTHGWRARLLALTAGLTIAACQSTPPATSAPTATAGAASPAATVAPSPTESADVVALFAAKAGSFKSGVMKFTGSATVGLTEVKLSGNTTFSGFDNSSQVSATVAGVEVQSETVQVVGKRYSRTGTGPWLEIPITNTSGDLSTQIGSAAKGSLKDEGTEDRNGQTVHKLVPSSTGAFDPSALLSGVTGAQDMHVDLAFYVTGDGTPVAASITATWTQKVGEQSYAGSLEFELTFSSLGQPQTIRIPEDVWVKFTSSRYHFAIAHPDDWTFFKAKGADELDAPTYAYVLASRQKSLGYTLNQWAKNEAASLKSFLGGKSISNEATTLGGVQARFLSGSGKAKQLGKTVVVYEVVAVKGGFEYFIVWVSQVGKADADKATFLQILSTWAYT